MKLRFVRTSVTPFHMAPSQERKALELMELCGRTAYKSEEKITEDSARAFVLMLKKHGHLSVLEHSNVVLKVEAREGSGSPREALESLRVQLLGTLNERSAFHRVALLQGPSAPFVAVAGNFRSWIETQNALRERDPELHAFFQPVLENRFPSMFPAEDKRVQHHPFSVSLLEEQEQLQALRDDPRSDLPNFVFKIVCDRGITHEVVRHRVFSFTQESTRYVNYGNRGMVLMVPEELEACFDDRSGELDEHNELVKIWKSRGEMIFQWYQEDLQRGLKPQIARDILPNLLKSEIFVTGRWSGWQHFIQLRESPAAHPRIRSIAREVRHYFEDLGLSPEA